MTRFLLFAFVLYQLVTLPKGTSWVANGIPGSALATIALIVAIVIWAIRHNNDTSFQPFSLLLGFGPRE